MKKSDVAYDPSKVQQKLMLALESTILQNVANLETSLRYYDAAIPGESHSTEIYDTVGKIKSLLESLSLKATKAITSNGKVNSSPSKHVRGSSASIPLNRSKGASQHNLSRTQRWESLYAKDPTAKATVKRNIDI